MMKTIDELIDPGFLRGLAKGLIIGSIVIFCLTLLSQCMDNITLRDHEHWQTVEKNCLAAGKSYAYMGEGRFTCM